MVALPSMPIKNEKEPSNRKKRSLEMNSRKGTLTESLSEERKTACIVEQMQKRLVAIQLHC